MDDASKIVADLLVRQPPADRPRFLRDLLAHAAAGIVVIEGERAAAEAVFRVADAVVTRRNGAAS
jgi:hypothetical protein